ncbi:MAG: sugar ABC transporter permease [Chloroflexi bacterium]|nr:sugar ABC transporter permease [Chloroflexota bacterium]
MMGEVVAESARTSDRARPRISWFNIFGGRRALLAYALIPAILFFAVFWLYPLGVGFTRSFTNWSPMSVRAPEFIGLANYERAFSDRLIGIAILNSVKFAVFTVGLRLAIALPIAIMLNNLRRGRDFFRLVYFLPVVTSVIAAGVIWRFLYLPRNGILNTGLVAFQQVLGLSFELPRYLQDPNIALFSVGVMSVWRWLGFVIVLLMAGLSSIPGEFYEAARIDGASRLQLFRRITLPLLRPTLVFVLVTEIASELQVFTEAFVMVSRGSGASLGGPANSTLTIVMLFYQSAFRNFEFGYASTIAVIIFVIVAAFSIVQLWLGRRRWEY